MLLLLPTIGTLNDTSSKKNGHALALFQVDLPSKWEELTARLLRLVKTREEILATSFIVLSCHQAKITPLKKR
jgi:hypothetical protein